MLLSELKLYNFRNLKDQTVSFSDGINLIIGKNGQGKTNVLEAINLISTARSFRSNKISDLVFWGKHESSVFGSVILKDQTKINLGIALERKLKRAFINDAQAKSADEFIGKLVCVTFTPSDLELVRGGPSERRRFLDKSLAFLDAKFIRTLSSYNAALKSKNQILRNAHGRLDENIKDQLYSWGKVMAKHGAEILKARKSFIERISQRSEILYKDFAPKEELLGLALKSARTKIEPSEFLLFEEMSEAMEREVAQGQSLIGPHRDDLIITLSGSDSRAFASQGQTRSIVLALKLALIEEIQAIRKESPVILLDDVDSELDQGRREAFFKSILSHGRQVIITATNAKEIPLPKSEIKEMIMESGKISLP